MKVDGGVDGGVGNAVKAAKDAEADQLDGVWCPEANCDAVTALMAMTLHTGEIEIGSSVIAAFARNPMSLAYTAHDLQFWSKGRFILGLGTQIQRHIEDRFSMEWSQPVERMREFILALHAIWDAWARGAAPAFEGRFYHHSVCPLPFIPVEHGFGHPPVYMGAVGPRMTTLAGEVAAGLILHGFTTRKYLDEVTFPALDRGLAQSGRARNEIEVVLPGIVMAAESSADEERARDAIRLQLAFYATTPSYSPVLECHGWMGLHDESRNLLRRGDWDGMASLVSDEIVDEFAIVAHPTKLAGAVVDRFGSEIDRLVMYAPFRDSRKEWEEFLSALRYGFAPAPLAMDSKCD